MKLKKYICAFAALLVVLSGCSSGPIMNAVTVKEVYDKIDAKGTFIVVFTQTDCVHCKTFKEILGDYDGARDLKIQEMILDKEPDQAKAVQELTPFFPQFQGTPDIYFIENGEIKSRFWNEYEEQGLTAESFDAWIEKHDLKKIMASNE